LKTILEEFIDASLKNHEEPARKGTPKGHQIGVSKVKLHAALLTTLFSHDMVQAAEAAGVSYGLLRKWKTEEGFKRVCQDILDNIHEAAIWPAILQLSNPLEINRQLRSKDFNPAEIKCTIDVNPFADARFYSESLRKQICQKLPLRVKGLDPVLILPVYKLINYLFVEWDRPRGNLDEKEIKSILNKGINTVVMKTLETCSANEYEKRKALWLMSILQAD